MNKNILTLLLLFPLFLSAQLKINEIMPKNVSAVMDESYNYSMWVEIYNTSESRSTSLLSVYFTDDLSQPQKWKPAYRIISPLAYHTLWFEREDRTGHASFKLSPSGGKLYMLDAQSTILDSVVYPSQYRNVSYGRKTDGADEWTFFEQYSPGKTNNGNVYKKMKCPDPAFATKGGFYTSTINVKFHSPVTGDTIFYTSNSAEPTRKSTRYVPGSTIVLNRTTVIRARTFSAQKLPSNVTTSTFFFRERNFKLPVVSIVTEQANLSDNTIGIYVEGTNGIRGNGMDRPANWNQDWDRPANFELYDTTKVVRLNQELDIAIAGGWTRMNGQKSLKINPKNKHGNNKLDYDIFAATKPNQKYNSILLRNSGNDFGCSMMRDAFMTSIVLKRMDLDYMAYEPAVCFINGVYYGIQNLRERSNEDLIYSNYGLKEEEVHLIEAFDMPADTEYLKLVNYIAANNMNVQSVYDKVCTMMDVDNFADYMMAEMYFADTDWPQNNIKAWKRKTDGRWRWILQDTDFGFGLYDVSNYNFNSLSYILDFNDGKIDFQNVSRKIMKGLLLNDKFKKKFIDRFCIQLSSTFATERVDAIMDSLSAKIRTEIQYHKYKWGSARNFDDDLRIMKYFSKIRPDNMMGFLSGRFENSTPVRTIGITSNTSRSSYKFNNELVADSQLDLKYFHGKKITVEANTIPGFQFKYWEITGTVNLNSLIDMGALWKYSDGNSVPAVNWSHSDYNDAGWKSGTASFGYGALGHVTAIGYGSDPNNKYPTAYFRKTIDIQDLNSKSDFELTVFADDGAVVYVNGTEVGRFNMPEGAISFNTYTLTYNNGETAYFNVPKALLKEGDNTIAVEVHQCNATSSDLIFDLSLTCQTKSDSRTIEHPVYSTTLNSNLKMHAVYEDLNIEDPDKNMRVVMNEFVTSNGKIQDEFGEFDDYIELFNVGDNAVNIAGWYISDKPTDKTLFQIPSTDQAKTLLPSKGRLILWADGQPEQGPLHIGFSLSKDGETVVLSRINYLDELLTVDMVQIPALAKNMSYSRLPDGSDNWVIQVSTFNGPNTDVTLVNNPVAGCKVYPTFVADYFMVEGEVGGMIKVMDITGKVLEQRRCNADKERVDISFLQKGIYIVLLGNDKFKIIKN